LLYLIHHFTSAVISFSRITFSILIRETTSHGNKNLLATEIFRSDKFQAITLSLKFFAYQVGNCGIFHSIIYLRGQRYHFHTKHELIFTILCPSVQAREKPLVLELNFYLNLDPICTTIIKK